MLPVALLISLGVATPSHVLSFPDAKRVIPKVNEKLGLVKSALAKVQAHAGRQMSEEGEGSFNMDDMCEILEENEDELREAMESGDTADEEVAQFFEMFKCFCTSGMRAFLEKHEDFFSGMDGADEAEVMEMMLDLFAVMCAERKQCGFFLDSIFTGLEEEDPGVFAAGKKMAQCLCHRPGVIRAIMEKAIEYIEKDKEPPEEEFLEAAFGSSAVGFCSSDICKAAIQAQPDTPKGVVQEYCDNVPPPSGGSLVKIEATVKGSVDDFDEDAYKGKLASYLEVEESTITLTVTPASVKVSAEVETGSAENAVTAVLKAEALAEDEEIASDILGVEVEAMAVEDPTNAGEYQEALGDGNALEATKNYVSPTLIVGVACGVGIPLLLLAAVFFYCRRKGKKSTPTANA